MIHPFTWIQSWHSLFSCAVSGKTHPSLLKANFTVSALTKLLIHASAGEKNQVRAVSFFACRKSIFSSVFVSTDSSCPLETSLEDVATPPWAPSAVGASLGTTPLQGLRGTWQSQDPKFRLLVPKHEQWNQDQEV